MFPAVMKSAAAVWPQEVQENIGRVLQLALSMTLDSGHVLDVSFGSITVIGRLARLALYARNWRSWAKLQLCRRLRCAFLALARTRIRIGSSTAIASREHLA
jgi:hypothetical protein